jgi:hypothetical protein
MTSHVGAQQSCEVRLELRTHLSGDNSELCSSVQVRRLVACEQHDLLLLLAPSSVQQEANTHPAKGSHHNISQDSSQAVAARAAKWLKEHSWPTRPQQRRSESWRIFFVQSKKPRISPQLPCRESATAQTNNLIVKSSSQMMNCTATVERIRQRDDVCAVRRSRWLPCIRNGL